MKITEKIDIRFPKTLAEAVRLQASENTRGKLLAGGTDLMVQWAAGVPVPERATSVWNLPELCAIEVFPDRIEIGAGVTHAFLRDAVQIHRHVPALIAAAATVGAKQIQARGTLGGNLASGSPAADGVAALAALDATLVLRSLRGARRVPLAGFYTGYRKSVLAADELIEAVEVALPPEGSPFAWRKVGTRQAQAISKVAFAAVAVVAGGRATRLGLGMASVAPTVALLPATRALGLSRPLAELADADVEAAVLADVSPIDDVRSTAAYRRHVAVRLVTRFFEELRGT